MKKLRNVGRFSICENRGALHVRWWDQFQKKTRSQRLQAANLTAAEAEVREKMRILAAPTETINPASGNDPTFGEIWLSFEQSKRGQLSEQRFRLLRNRLDLYYKTHLWHIRASQAGPAIRKFAKDLANTTYSIRKGKAGKSTRPADQKLLHPNTINDIVQTARAVYAHAQDEGLSGYNPPRMPDIHGTTAPSDRTPKGRYVSLEEMGALINACRRPHVLDMLLLDIGCAGRIGAVGSLTAQNIHFDLGVIDLLDAGEIESNKRKPIVPISGPMKDILRRLTEAHPSGPLLGTRSKTNYTQIIQRLVSRAGIDEDLRPGSPRANWYSIRRTMADWLDERVSNAALSSVMGHLDISRQDRSRLFDRGSPMTDIYKRRKLGPVLEVQAVMDEEFWPALQQFTTIGLSATDAAKTTDAADSLMRTDAPSFKSARKTG